MVCDSRAQGKHHDLVSSVKSKVSAKGDGEGRERQKGVQSARADKILGICRRVAGRETALRVREGGEKVRVKGEGKSR